MARRPNMPVNWAEYLGDTRHLTTLEHGAYWMLMGHYWQHSGLPTGEGALTQIAGLTVEQWAAARDTLRALFKLGNWKHKRIEADLAEAERISAAGRRGGQASAAAREKRRQKPEQPQEVVTIVAEPLQRSANDPPTIGQPLKKESKEERTLEPSGSNGACAPPIVPVYTDSRHELWGEGKPILVALGLSENRAGQMIGQWLKATKDDAQTVLGAIQRARDNRVIDPIPWITRALKFGDKNGTSQQGGDRAGGQRQGLTLSGLALQRARAAGVNR